MFFYTSGDLLQSDAQALVNTVNCEGYMGKGIAYQFKLKFPETNKDYVKTCRNGLLRPGTLHYFCEQDKVIINFPTKDQWRAKSKMEYIDRGLDELVLLIDKLQIQSIAIPPLGSGNGGLIWKDVKELICKKLQTVAETVNIYIYEPSHGYISKPTTEPPLSTSALILMEIKHHLNIFSKFRLQKTAYFVDLFAEKKYFKFVAYKHGPYDHSIDIISNRIREFQAYHETKNTEEAKEILYHKIVSETVDAKLSELMPHIEKACSFVDSIKTDHQLECVATICFLIESEKTLPASEIIQGFKLWSPEKAKRFSANEILDSIDFLETHEIINESLIGYKITSQ